ncbi:hypothetical protein BC827DRAFT_1145505, partial [Russula dissimulans]
RLTKEWTSPIYAFFQPRPSIEFVNGRRCHEFRCTAPQCKGRGSRPCNVHCFLDTCQELLTLNS